MKLMYYKWVLAYFILFSMVDSAIGQEISTIFATPRVSYFLSYGHSGWWMPVEDLDGDGDKDAIYIELPSVGESIIFFLKNNNGIFNTWYNFSIPMRDAGQYWDRVNGYSLFNDLDHDGKKDMLLRFNDGALCQFQQSRIYWNTGDDNHPYSDTLYTHIDQGGSCSYLLPLDMTDDGFDDLLMESALSPDGLLLINNGNRTFSHSNTNFSTRRDVVNSINDLNKDGKKDIIGFDTGFSGDEIIIHVQGDSMNFESIFHDFSSGDKPVPGLVAEDGHFIFSIHRSDNSNDMMIASWDSALVRYDTVTCYLPPGNLFWRQTVDYNEDGFLDFLFGTYDNNYNYTYYILLGNADYTYTNKDIVRIVKKNLIYFDRIFKNENQWYFTGGTNDSLYIGKLNIQSDYAQVINTGVPKEKSICLKDTGCYFISPDISLTPDTTILSGMNIFFSSGYEKGNDFLEIIEKYGITAIFDTLHGILSITGKATGHEYQEVLSQLCYRNSSANTIHNKKTIQFVIGDALFNPENAHYYKLVTLPNPITWHEARDSAAASNYFGLQGYLVTITSVQENEFINSLISTNTWIGASDEAEEGVWRWVTGCEGLEECGKGRHFSNQFKEGNCFSSINAPGINGNYANWYFDDSGSNRGGEPNDCGCPVPGNHCEDYGHVLYDGLHLEGEWNDWPNSNGVTSYIIEYGCMPYDPIVSLSDSIVLNLIKSVSTTINVSICSNSTYILPDGSQVSTAGTYIDTLVTLNGCDSIITTNLTILDEASHHHNFTIVANPDGKVPLGSEITLTISNPLSGVTYNWYANGLSIGMNSPEITTIVSDTHTVYSVEITNNLDSICTATGEIAIDAFSPTIRIPNAFTPNNDNRNDRFRAVIDPGIEIVEMVIVSRWGEVMYSGSGNGGWDGRYKNQEAQADTYLYKVRYKFTVSGEQKEARGEVTLLR